MDNMVKTIRKISGLVQWTNTTEVITWFKNIQNKQMYKFIQFDIVGFYPNIKPTLLDDALAWAAGLVDLSAQQKKIIFQARKSFLYLNGKPWVKKGDVNFDVGMGSYDGAQVCELVGLFILSQMTHLPDYKPGKYRDDGLGVTNAGVIRQKEICVELKRIYSENGLKITCDINRHEVNFLDVNLNLETGLFRPYMKEGGKPIYVNSKSNHPPAILKNIPHGINRRLSNREVFDMAVAAPPYQTDKACLNKNVHF